MKNKISECVARALVDNYKPMDYKEQIIGEEIRNKKIKFKLVKHIYSTNGENYSDNDVWLYYDINVCFPLNKGLKLIVGGRSEKITYCYYDVDNNEYKHYVEPLKPFHKAPICCIKDFSKTKEFKNVIEMYKSLGWY